MLQHSGKCIYDVSTPPRVPLILFSNFSHLVHPLASRPRLCLLRTNNKITLSRWGKHTLAQGVSSQCLIYIPFQRNEVHRKLFNKAFQSLKERRIV